MWFDIHELFLINFQRHACHLIVLLQIYFKCLLFDIADCSKNMVKTSLMVVDLECYSLLSYWFFLFLIFRSNSSWAQPNNLLRFFALINGIHINILCCNIPRQNLLHMFEARKFIVEAWCYINIMLNYIYVNHVYQCQPNFHISKFEILIYFVLKNIY